MLTRITITANQVGLVFKNGNVVRVITAGSHWIFFNEQVEIHDMTTLFFTTREFNILLKNAELASMLEVIEVKDGEVVFVYVNGNFKEVLTAGRYAFWKGIMQYKFIAADTSKIEISDDIPKSLLELPKVKILVRKFTVLPNEKAVLFVDGKFLKELVSGSYYFWNNNISVEIKSADLRTQHLEIAGQELLTKDKAGLRINFFVRFRVLDIVVALTQNKDFEKQLYIMMQLALRESVGTLALDELLSRKDTLGTEILESVTAKALEMGIEIADAGIRDVILPGDMKEIMNQVLVAEKKAQANTIMRREETASTRSLLNTAKLMEDNAMLFKLKEMEYVEKIAEKINNIS